MHTASRTGDYDRMHVSLEKWHHVSKIIYELYYKTLFLLSLPLSLSLSPQEFIGRDPLQTTNLLDLLLTQNGKSDLIVPLFQPNLCPEQFLHMYGSAAEICVKDGASIAFSVLTKVGITS